MSKKWWENDPVASNESGSAGNWWENDPVAGETSAAPKKKRERSVGGVAADISKSFGGAAISAVGSVPSAIGRAVQEGGETLFGLSMDEARVLAEAEGTPEKALEWYERSNRLNPLSNIGRGIESVGQWVSGQGDKLRGSRSEEAKELARQSTPDGDITKPSTWTMGENPTVEGVAHVISDVTGSMSPQVATAIATRGKSATTQMRAGGAVTAGQIGGAAMDEASEYLGQFNDEQLRQASPVFRELEAKGYSPTDARTILLRQAENRAATYAAPVGYVGGQATGALLGKPGERIAAGLANTPAKMSVLGALGATEEALQEMAEGVATRAGINDAAGTNRSLTEGTFGEAVLGAKGGGVMGAGKGAIEGLAPRVDGWLNREQNQTPGAAGQTETPTGEAPSPMGGNAAPTGRVPGARTGAAVEAVGVGDTAEAERRLREPVNLTALDRANEIDAELSRITERRQELTPENGYGPAFDQERTELEAQAQSLSQERDSIAQTWPKAQRGAPTSFSTEAGVRLQGQYALMDAADLITSHDESLRPSPLYPQELQPRDRSRSASEMQVSGIVQKLDPARLGVSADAATGAPIVGADGLVESGNARTIALKRVYQANGQKAEDYKQFLRENAAQFGIAPEQIDSMQRPVLVRVRQTPVNRAEFARQANASTVQRMSPSEQALTDAKRLNTLEGLNPDDDGNFTSSHDFIRQFMATLPVTEQSDLIESDGRLSTQGYRRIQNAVLAKAYGDSPTLRRMTESLDNNLRNISNALTRVAPTIAAARERMQMGTLHEADIAPDLIQAVEGLSALKDKGWSVADELGQRDLTGPKYSPEAAELLQFLSDNARSPRRIADFVQRYYEALEAAGDPSQPSMFGDTGPAPTRANLLNTARGTAGQATPATDQSKPIDQLTNEDWAGVIGAIRGPARADGPNETISIDDATMLKKMVVKAIKDGVKAGKTREQIIAQIDGLTKGGISNAGMNRINALIEGATNRSEGNDATGNTQRGIDRPNPTAAAQNGGQPQNEAGDQGRDQGDGAARPAADGGQQGEPESEADPRAEAVAQFKDALADLAEIATRHTRATMLPENTPGLMPTLVKLFDAAIKIVGTDLKQATKWVKSQMKADERTRKIWNKIDNATYQKAALQALESRPAGAQAGLFDDLEAATEAVQGNLFANPERPQLEKLIVGKDAPPKDKPVVLVYGGSFNPIHAMHVEIARQAKQMLEQAGYTVSTVQVSPSPQSLLVAKSGAGATSLTERTAMAKKAFAGMDGFVVTDEPSRAAAEITGKLKRTQQADWTRAKYPDASVVSLAGADTAPGSPPGFPSLYSGDQGTSHEGYYYLAMPRDESDSGVSSSKVRKLVDADQPVPVEMAHQEVVRHFKAIKGKTSEVAIDGILYDGDAENFGMPQPPITLPDNSPLLQETNTKSRDSKVVFEGREMTRGEMRDLIVDRHFAKHSPAPADRKPVAYVMGGGGASGKGTIKNKLKRQGLIQAAEAIDLDPDEIKFHIPEFNAIKQAGDSRGAATVHEESSDLAKVIKKRAIDGRYDLILDVTLGNKDKGIKYLQELKQAGYEVRLYGVTVQPEVAVVRAMLRAQKIWRYVPISHLLEAHKGFNAAFADYAEIADEARLYENTDGNLNIAEKKDGALLTVNGYNVVEQRSQINEKATTLKQIGRNQRGQGFRPGARQDGGSEGQERSVAGRPGPDTGSQNPGVGQEGNVGAGEGNEPAGQLGLSFVEGSDYADNRSGEGRAQGQESGAAQGADRQGRAQQVRRGSGRPDQQPGSDNDAGGQSARGVGQAGGDGVRRKDAGGNQPQSRDRAGRNAGVPAGRDIPPKTGRNYAFGPDDLTYEGSWQKKAEQNVEAVELLLALEKEGRQATREEQAKLAKFIGWGSSEIANTLFGKKLDKIASQKEDYDRAIASMDALKRDYLNKGGQYRGSYADNGYYQAVAVLREAGKVGPHSYPDRVTRDELNQAKPSPADMRWLDLRDRLKAALTPQEWAEASRSTQYAHYTSKEVVRAMWGAMSRMGFKGGSVLEPGSGIGVFPGLMPADMAANSIYTGIEYDSITGRILKQLFPDERILVESFVDSKLPKNFYDVAAGNPPFSGTKILSDPEYAKRALSLHDYFFAKSIDRVKPGGLVMYVTSRYTMDKLDDKARQYLADRADLVGAIRLPQTAFKQNAGTEVVTDVIFLRKKVPGETFEQAQPWLKTAEVKDASGQTLMVSDSKGGERPAMINEYFAAHPEMVLGQHANTGSMYADKEYTVTPLDGDIEALFAKAVENLPTDIYHAERGSSAEAAKVREIDFNPKAKKEGNYYVTDAGVLMQREGGVGQRVELKNPKDVELIKDFVPLRDALKQAHYDQLNDADWEASLRNLQTAYDAFTKKHGPINQSNAKTVKVKVDELDEDGNPTGKKVEDEEVRRSFPLLDKLADDPDWTLVAALESVNEDTGEVKPSAFLSKRVLGKPEPAAITTPMDAMLTTLNDLGHVDIPTIAERVGLTEAETIEALGSAIYEDPEAGWVTADEYLSGNVKRKLELARQAAESDRRLERNAQALEASQPEPLSPSQIDPRIGMNWIPSDVYERFMREVLGLKMGIEWHSRTKGWVLDYETLHTHKVVDRWGKEEGVFKSEEAAKKSADKKNARYGDNPRYFVKAIETPAVAAATEEWGTVDVPAQKLMEIALGGSPVRVTSKDKDGNSVFNPAATEAAKLKLDQLHEKFASWVFSEPQRADRLVRLYNDKFNTNVARKFDGRHLTLPGASAHWQRQVHAHVKRGVWRIVQSGNTYLAHAVGSGKTAQMVMSAMEQKRLGLVKKPMIVVPNHMLKQMASEWLDIYPAARIMVADEHNFHTDNRRRFVSRVALSDLDGVVITHSAFKLLDLDPAFKQKMIEEQLAFFRAALEEAGGKADEKGKSQDPKIKRIEKQIENMEQKLKAAMSDEGKDKNVRFDELGVDFLYVDEAHEFRKLDFTTNRQVKGISPLGSARAFDLYMKSRYLEEKTPGRSLVLASGTPVTNTVGELYTVQRLLGHQALAEKGIEDFDSWASMFGREKTTLEPNAAGKYDMVTRFQDFANVPELTQMFREFADVLTADHLAELLGDKRPKVEDGSRKIVVTPETAEYEEFRAVLEERMETSRAWKPSPDEPNNPDPIIKIIGDGRLAAIDMRFMDPKLPSNPDSKLNRMIDDVIAALKETADYEYRGKNKKDADGKEIEKSGDVEPNKGATAMVFSDLGFGAGVAEHRGFNARAWFEKRLRDAGIPMNQVAFMSDYKKSSAKLKLFSDVNAGRVRLLIGSSKNMGTGVNAQQRLKDLFHLDSPWYPADIEQREGRIVRQGNKNPEVRIRAYAAKGTYDSQMWGQLANKQMFIDKALSGDPTVRKIEDAGSADLMAMAAGMVAKDPRVLVLAGLNAEIAKLQRLYQAHEDARATYRSRFNEAQLTAEWNEKRLPEAIKAAEKAQDLSGDKFRAKAGGKTYTDRTEWAEALIEQYKSLTARGETKPQQVGEISGFPIAYGGQTVAGQYMTKLMLGTPNPVELVTDPGTSPMGVAMRAQNAAVDVARQPTKMRERIVEARAQMDALQTKLETPFPMAGMLADKIKERDTLQMEMAAPPEPDAPVAEEPAAAYNAAYETDLFGQPVPAPVQRAARAKRSGSTTAGDVRPAATLPGDTTAPDADYYVRTIVGKAVDRQLGTDRILTPEDAAQATAYLYRSAVERFDAIVTDKDGKPLAIVGNFKGAVSQTSVYPGTVMGEAIRVPGAAHIWFSHNHPSGTAALSHADANLNATISNVFRGSGIEPMGLLAVAGDRYAFAGPAFGPYALTQESGAIPEPKNGATVPVIERETTPPAKDRPMIGGPADAMRLAASFYKKGQGPGLMLLDSQHRLAAWMPLPANMRGRLRDTGGLGSLYRAVSESNASAAILVHGGELDARLDGEVTIGQNIAAALPVVDVRPLDSINAVTLKSAAEKGIPVAKGPVLSRGAGTGGMDVKALGELTRRIQAAMPNLPKVHVLSDPSKAPKALREYINRQDAWNDVEGAMHDGELYLFASGLSDPLRAEHVLAEHEAAHFGLRAILGNKLRTAMNLVYAENASVRRAVSDMQKRGKLSITEAVEEVIVDIPSADLARLKGWRKVVQMAADWLGAHGFERMAQKLTNWLDGTLSDQRRADLFVAELVRSAREYVAGKRPGDFRGMRGTRLSATLADDIAAQEQWLQSEARARGFKDIEDLLEKNYPLFEKLASLWREKNPADTLLSRSPSTKAAYEQRIDELFAGAKANLKGVRVLDRTEVLGLLGHADKPVVLAEGKVLSGQKNHPRMTAEIWKKIPDWLDSPAAVFESDTEPGRLVFVAPEMVAGSMALVIVDPKEGALDAHLLLNAYDKDNGAPPIASWVRKELTRYVDQKKFPTVLDASGLRLPGTAFQNKPGTRKILTQKDLAGYIKSNPSTALSRAGNNKTASQRADDIIADATGRTAPLDAATRLLTRATGVERLTGAIYDRAAYLFGEWTPERVKAGVVSDYGVPEAVIDQRVMLQGRQRVQLRKAGELIDKLSTLTRAESRVAYEWMNMDGSDPKAYLSMMQGLPEESVKVLTDVQKMIDQLSKEAVRLGQLSPDAYERNKFAYLRRSYAKHILEQTSGEKAKRARVISILGDQYKGRGLSESAPMDKIKAAAPEWWGRKLAKGKADTALKGEKFVRLEYRVHKQSGVAVRQLKDGKTKPYYITRTVPLDTKTGQIPGLEVSAQDTMLKQVVYWPADEKIPAQYAEWDKAGTWEVRDVKGPNAIFWRDFTKDEREMMGEVDEARFAIAKTLHGMIHDVEVGRYLEWMSMNQAKKEGETIPGAVVEASERMRDTFAPNEWVRVPDTKISGTNVFKYGKLAGRYIPGPVWNDIRQVVAGRFKPFGETYAKVLLAWKLSKTALSPAVHMNNVMSNFIMADWHDVGAKHVAKSLRIILAASKREGKGLIGNVSNAASRAGIADREAAREILTRYSDSGGEIGSWVENEIRDDQLAPLMESLEKELLANGNSVQAQTGVFAALQHAMMLRFPSAWEAFKPSLPGRVVVTEAANLIDLYQHEDDVFRLAAWLKAKEEGLSDTEAGKVARKSFLDYHINAPWIQAMRQSFWPFISFTYRAVPMLLEVAGKKPHKLMKLMMVLGTLNALGMMMAGGDDEERKLLPEEKAGRIWGIVPKLIRMPWNDQHGSPVYLDIRRFVPVGDVFDVGAGQAAIPMFPGLMPGGPLIIAGEVLWNKSTFTGKPITLDTDTGAQQAAKVADHLYKAFAPNIVVLPNTYAFEGVMGSFSGRTDAFGREMSTAQATASAFGIKLGSYPTDVLRRNQQAKAQAQIMEIQKNISQLKRQRQTNRVSEEEFMDAVQVEREKQQKVMRELVEKMQ